MNFGQGWDLVPVRLRRLFDKVLLTSPWGDWIFVTPEELKYLQEGCPAEGDPLKERLAERRFIASRIDWTALSAQEAEKKSFADCGPNLHIVVVSGRCNQSCLYCHASRRPVGAQGADMTRQTAERVVDFIFRSTSPRLTIEFQGGEPLLNFDVIRFIIEKAKQKNRAHEKLLEFTLVSNLSLLDESKLEYLINERVQICTSLDGTVSIHDKQRVLPGASSHQQTLMWMKRINQKYAQLGLDPELYHVEALLTTTRNALAFSKEIVDAYVNAGCKAIFLRPLDPFGFAADKASLLEYDRKEFLLFYRKALDYILELNKKGVQIIERFASIFLTKILRHAEPNYLDLRSPCGAALGQLAYNHDGSIYTCDEGRLLAERGDPFFALGTVDQSQYRKLMLSDTVRALALASNLRAQPECQSCVYQPYCGVCPVHNYITQGSIFGRMRESSLCAVYKGIQDYLFELLAAADPETQKTLHRWTLVRNRVYFIQPS